MWNNIQLPTRQRASRKDYLAARDDWLKCVLGDRNLSGRAKIAAGAIYFFFNYEGFGASLTRATPTVRHLLGFGELDMLMPAYQATIHKSQGSEYPAVIIPLLTRHRRA
jgi:hypothetical protein